MSNYPSYSSYEDPTSPTTKHYTIFPYRTADYNSAIFTENGEIYFIPNNQTTVLVRDTSSNIYDATTLTLTNENEKWKSGVLAPNGKIYCAPSMGNSYLIIDTQNDIIDTTSIVIEDAVPEVEIKWCSNCLTPNGKIYSTPVNETRILILDTNTEQFTTLLIQNGGYFSSFYVSSINKIFSPPGNISSNQSVLVADLNEDIIDTTSIILKGNYYESIVSGVDGRLYCAPFTLPLVSGSIGIISPQTNITDSTSLPLPNGSSSDPYNFRYRGLMSSPDNFLYYMPGSQTLVIVIDPIRKTVLSKKIGNTFYDSI